MNNLIKELEMARNQYNAVVEQNKSLQAENRDLKKNKVDVTVKDINKASLKAIEKIIENICVEECGFKWGKNTKHCGDDDCRYMRIMEQVKKVKEVKK